MCKRGYGLVGLVTLNFTCVTQTSQLRLCGEAVITLISLTKKILVFFLHISII